MIKTEDEQGEEFDRYPVLTVLLQYGLLTGGAGQNEVTYVVV